MIKFNDIMKKFYEDEMLGIQSEDAPANSIAGGGVSLPADAVKKKKKMYDGRTRESKAFMKRMLELRAKRDASFRNSVKENVESFGNEYLFEANVDILQKIVKDKQNNKIKLKDGTLRIDLFSASALTQALDKVKPDTKKKMTDIINSGSKGQLMKLLSIIMK